VGFHDIEYDVFLCHGGQDKPLARELARGLQQLGVRVFLDEDEIRPGQPWQEALESAIRRTRAAAILYGPNGMGPWSVREMRALLDDLTQRDAPIIPVLLPGSPPAPEIPLFLRQHEWIDLREGLSPDGLARLANGLRGSSAEGLPPPRRWAPLRRGGLGLGALAILSALAALGLPGSPTPAAPASAVDAGAIAAPSHDVEQRVEASDQARVRVSGGMNVKRRSPGKTTQGVNAKGSSIITIQGGMNIEEKAQP